MRLPLLLLAVAAVAVPGAALAAPAAGAPAAAPGQAEYTPEGAPRDDYNFVAWCEGVLEGHMALAEHVQSVLPLDEAQTKIGRAYLDGYEKALKIGRKGRSDAELDAAQAIRFSARANWNTAMAVDLRLGADTYLAWQLPGRCEHAAKRVAKRDDLFQLAPSLEDVESMRSGMAANDAPVGRGAAPAAAPARVEAPVAAPAPVEAPAAPVFTESMPSAMIEPVPAAADEAPELVSVSDLTMAPSGDEGGDEAAMTAAALDEPLSDEPVLVEDAPAADPAPVEAVAAPAPAPATTTAQPTDNRIVRMPRKGRLFPWGKRE